MGEFRFENTNPDHSKYTYKSGDPGEYFLVQYDSAGYLVNDSVNGELRRELLDPAKRYTDVVIIAHGWNTRVAKDGSLGTVTDSISSLHETEPVDRKCLYVLVAWPSHVPTTLFERDNKTPRQKISSFLGDLVRAWTEGSSPILSGIFQVLDLKEKVLQLNDLIGNFLDANEDYDKEIPEAISRSIADLSNELRNQGCPLDTSTKSLLDTDVNSDETVKTVTRRFDFYNDKDTEMAEDEELGVAKSISGLKADKTMKKSFNILMTLFDVFYRAFERRASLVGSHGLHDLLAHIMKHSSNDVRMHLVGYSMGVHVVQSAAIGREYTGSNLSRKIHSLMLVQGACSTNVYGKGGPYRPMISKLRPIAGPILATVMEDDFALDLYDLFLPDPLGKFGFDSHKPYEKDEITLNKFSEGSESQKQYEFKRNTMYNVLAKNVIPNHFEISAKEIWSLFWQAATTDIENDGYLVTDSGDLPKNFWSNYEIRNEVNLWRWLWNKLMEMI